MESLQQVFPRSVGSVRSCSFPPPPCETLKGHPSQETTGDEWDGGDPSLPRNYIHELGDDVEPGGDPHGFRPSELYSRNHQTRDKECWEDFDNTRALEGVITLSFNLSRGLTSRVHQVGPLRRRPIRAARTFEVETHLKIVDSTALSQPSFPERSGSNIRTKPRTSVCLASSRSRSNVTPAAVRIRYQSGHQGLSFSN